MVRIIPKALKPGLTGSAAGSRSASPMRSAKGELSSPEGAKDTGLTLKIVILRGRNLAAKDRGGSSDPYLVLTLGETKHATHAVHKSLNPEWTEICQMPVNGIQHLILDVACWDKDRFGKDYLGEFELALEEIFANNKTEQEPKWYPLRSKRPGKKTGNVSGEILLQFTLYDSTNTDATAQQIFDKLQLLTHAASADSPSYMVTPGATPMLAPTKSNSNGNAPPPLGRTQTDKTDLDDDEEDYEVFDDETPEDDDPSKPETAEKRKRRLRIKGLKRRKRNNPYEFSNGGSDVVGVVYLEICNIRDLPPESNLTRTSFDMDPFVVASLGKKTYRTKVVRHNLNPSFNEKMLFHVQGHEQQYSFLFTVIDRDKYSGNDFIASVNLPLQELIGKAPQADPETGLYDMQEPHEFEGKKNGSRSRFIKLPLSRSSSAQSLSKLARPPVSRSASGLGGNGGQLPPTPGPAPTSNPLSLTTSNEISQEPQQMLSANTGLLGPGEPSAASNPAQSSAPAQAAVENAQEQDDQDFHAFELPLKMKNTAKWEDKHNPVLHLRAKYVPYPALRQQFWRAMLKQYDTDDSGCISKVELTTMLDTLGSTLRESTIDSFFQRFPHKAKDGEESWDLTKDEVVICLEEQLSKPRATGPSVADKIKSALPDAEKMKSLLAKQGKGPGAWPQLASEQQADNNLLKPQVTNESQASDTSTLAVPDLATPGEEGDYLERDDLNVDRGEEHVVEIRECPICHQPRLNRRKDTDIITHIATCASSDWRQVNNLMMGGFVTASQAQRKWYSKVMTKISYGGYKLGANSANILVQDRITGQISEEKMSVYVRLGIRLLYKGIKSKDMETRRIRKLLKGLSIKQGKKFDDPASKAEIPKFIQFHQLDMTEVLEPVEAYKNFNEFFYRKLKPDARPPSAPDNPHIIVSPADCRCVVFNTITAAQKIWIKGRDFSIKRLLGDAYPEDASRYENGALGIFRLAPQDYHRFHIPVDGVMRKPKPITGEYYTVNPMAIRSALDVYGENVRVIVPIDSEVHGRVMVVCVGAMMVGSTVITRHEGEHVHRAEELGYFKFGGSTIVLLFEEGKMVFDDDLVDNSNGPLETLIRAGTSVGHSPGEPAWKPDMRKAEGDITEADKRDAKRRIQGAGFSEEGYDDSGLDDLSELPPPDTSV